MIWIKKFYENPIVTDYYLDTISMVFSNENLEIKTIRDWKEYHPHRDDITIVGTTLDALEPLIRKQKYILWTQGIWPEECYYNHHKKWEYYLTGIIEKVTLRKAEFVFFVSEAMKNHYEKKYHLSFLNRCYIMPCSNEIMHVNSFYEDDKYKKNIFCYAGSLNRWQCVEETLSLYKRIECRNQDAKLLMLVKDKDEALKLIKKYNIVNYEIDFVPVDELEDRLSSVKFGFIIRDDLSFNNVATPTKFSTYITNGIIPIISNCLYGISDMGKETNYVLFIDKNNDEKPILEIMNHEIDPAQVEYELTQIYQKYYDRDNHIDRVTELFRKNGVLK